MTRPTPPLPATAVPVSRSAVMRRAWAEYRSAAAVGQPFSRSLFAVSLRYAWQKMQLEANAHQPWVLARAPKTRAAKLTALKSELVGLEMSDRFTAIGNQQIAAVQSRITELSRISA